MSFLEIAAAIYVFIKYEEFKAAGHPTPFKQAVMQVLPLYLGGYALMICCFFSMFALATGLLSQ